MIALSSIHTVFAVHHVIVLFTVFLIRFKVVKKVKVELSYAWILEIVQELPVLKTLS